MGALNTRPRAGGRGQIIVLFALLLPVLIGLVGLAVDGGRLLAERRHLQAVADAAAWAAAAEVLYGSPENAEAAARWYADANGLGAGSGASVRVDQPPLSGPYAGQRDHVTVQVERSLTLTLMQIVHPAPFTVVAAATAGPTLGPAPYALFALNRQRGGIDLRGAVTVRVRDASVLSNYAITARGGASLVADEVVAANRSIAGAVQGLRGTVSNVGPLPDPFAALPPPPPPATKRDGLQVNGVDQVVTVQPGRWRGDLIVHGTNNQVVMAPGLYYFDQGADIEITGPSNRLIGDGVCIYLAPGSQLQVAGGADLLLRATADAPYPGAPAGLLIFAGRDNPGMLTVTGGASTSLQGTIYAPAAEVHIGGGNPSRVVYGQVFAGEIVFAGGGSLVVQYDPDVVAVHPRPALVAH
ncbi:MAG TPA: pilus assembly protein TadG-related protein [Chloroflexota bacterium]|nr:pilus assembly protein TadG-related protein [Chloroflexota bacterium]